MAPAASFSAGLDRSLFAPPGSAAGRAAAARRRGPRAGRRRIRGYQAGFRWLRVPAPCPVAAVQGHAIGAGAQLALACDLRVVAEDAQLRLPEAMLGLVPDLGGTHPLVELVGYAGPSRSA